MLRTVVIDFNSYFASVEQQLNHRLRGRPVVVVPVMTDSTCCIAASYEAKALGIKTGTLVSEAKRRCQDLIVVEAQHEKYVTFHHRAIAAIDTVLPIEAVMSIDEMACELPRYWSTPALATQKALEIKQVLSHAVGECLTVSIGIAPNRFLAKTASNLHKPDGLVLLDETHLPDALLHLPIEALTGIGRRVAQRLYHHGIHSMADLWRASATELTMAWGSVEGERFYAKLHGQRTSSLETQRGSISHSHVLPPALRTRHGAYGVLNRLTQKAAMRLRKMNYMAGAMAIHLKLTQRNAKGKREGWGREARLSPTQYTHDLIKLLDQLWVTLPMSFSEPMAVGMVLFDLIPPQQVAGSLFDTSRRNDLLYHTLDKLNLHYGKHTIYFAGAHATLNEAPMRIAFNHIPDIETEA